MGRPNVPRRESLITEQERGDPMLSKCANPKCAAIFRYLHEGKLYVMDRRRPLTGHARKYGRKSGQLEYAWLCSCCSLYLTIEIDEDFGTMVVRELGRKNDSEASHSANYSIWMEIA
jgi:hypothetical protein